LNLEIQKTDAPREKINVHPLPRSYFTMATTSISMGMFRPRFTAGGRRSATAPTLGGAHLSCLERARE
jgi:hypothetical protein